MDLHELIDLHRRTVATWTDRVAAVADDQWDAPTPCTEWSVRDLVNHVVGEERWTVPLARGATIAEIGSSLDGDLLGEKPAIAALEAAGAAVAAVDSALPADGTVHLSYGEERMSEYVLQLCSDHLVHAWDLASAVGADTRLEPDLVAAVAEWFTDREALYRSGGAIGPRPESGDDPQDRLLAAFGRRSPWSPS